MIKNVPLADIRIDGGTQQRPIDDPTVLKYAALMAEGVVFPEVTIAFDGKDNWLIDGFHRYHATRKLNKTAISAQVGEGTKREAIWMSFAANKDHGLPRQAGTLKDMLFKTVFPDKEWSAETDKGLADWVGASPGYICKCRKEFVLSKEPAKPKETTTPAVAQPKSPDVVMDSVRQEVPAHLVPIFERNGEIRMQIKTLNDILKACREANMKNDPLYANCKVDQLKSAISNARSVLRFSMAYAVCAYCGGDVNNQECGSCEGRGFLNDQQWRTVPDDMKEQ
jgi:hypothetical protein